MVTFITINKLVMVNHNDNEIKYIMTNPLILVQTSTIRVKQEEECCKPLLIDILNSSENKC